jgi:hypothetical protein
MPSTALEVRIQNALVDIDDPAGGMAGIPADR